MPNVKRMLRKMKPELKRLCGEDNEKFEMVYANMRIVLDDMAMLYRKGVSQRTSGKRPWSRGEFVAQHKELVYPGGEGAMPIEYHTQIVDMVYSAYTDGYLGVKR